MTATSDATTTDVVVSRYSPAPAVRRRMLEAVTWLTTPLLPDDYIGMINPMWSSRGLHGRVEDVHPETADSASLVIRPGRGWAGHRAGQYVRVGVDIRGVRHWRTYSLSSPPERTDGRTGDHHGQGGSAGSRLAASGPPGGAGSDRPSCNGPGRVRTPGAAAGATAVPDGGQWDHPGLGDAAQPGRSRAGTGRRPRALRADPGGRHIRRGTAGAGRAVTEPPAVRAAHPYRRTVDVGPVARRLPGLETASRLGVRPDPDARRHRAALATRRAHRPAARRAVPARGGVRWRRGPGPLHREHGDEGELIQTCVSAAAGPVEIDL